MGNSFHYQIDRKRREALIQEIGAGITVKTVEVDRGHRNGPENPYGFFYWNHKHL